jgi:cytochrome P450
MSKEVDLAGKTIQKGDFITYPLFDAHLNPNIYTNLVEFNPGPFSPGKEEDKREKFGYLGWGTGMLPFLTDHIYRFIAWNINLGRHPCTIMKVAKLKVKIIVALFVTGYEYDVVNSDGNPARTPPKPNHNNIHQVEFDSPLAKTLTLTAYNRRVPLAKPVS